MMDRKMKDRMGRAMARDMKFGGNVERYAKGGATPKEIKPPKLPPGAKPVDKPIYGINPPPGSAYKEPIRKPPKKPAPKKSPPKYEPLPVKPPLTPKKPAPKKSPPNPRDPRVRMAQRAARQARGGMGMPRGGMKAGGGVKKYAEGGSIYRKAADGIATKGKTRGMAVRMRKGGMC